MSDALLRNAYSQHEAGNLAEAARLYGEVLKAEPHHFEATCMLGLLHSQRGEWAAAGRVADEALRMTPRSAKCSYNLGCLLQGLNRHDEALKSYDGALAARPNYFEALIHRGLSLLALGNFEAAIESFDKAIALKPHEVGAWLNRGNALAALGRHANALAAYDQALAIAPQVPLLHFRRGEMLLALARHDQALAAFDAALALKPDHIDAMVSRAVAFRALGNLDAARASCDAALAIKPDCIEALVNRGTVLFETGRAEEAAADYERAIALKPDIPYVAGSLAHYKMNCCDWRDLDATRRAITVGVATGKPVIQPWIHLTFAASPDEQLQCARTFTARERRRVAPLWRGERYGHSRIRVAYLSADFHAHTTMFLLAGVFDHHDRSRFETTAVSYGPDELSGMRAGLKAAFDHFLDVRAKSDTEVAELLRQNEIDIAVDLKGYTQHGRAGILAHRPAPVQAQYLGYPGTMGTDDVDYILADPTLIPETDDRFYTEKVVRLPGSYQANDDTRQVPSAGGASREAAGLPDRAFVFASFNSVYKITPEAFAIWLRLLHQIEGSVLWLYADNAAAMRNLKRETEARGIAPDRLILAPRVSYSQHLERHHLADLFLDTFPCNAHTTASDALWAGLPILTLQGNTFAGRVAASLLQAIGLPELIADTAQAYEETALNLTHEPLRLAGIKAKLARNRVTHPLFDTARFTRHLEAAYVGMWERAERGLRPQSFAVEAEPSGAAP